MAICTLLGILIEGLAYKPLRGTPSLAVLITAIGVSYFLQNAAQLIWGAAPKNFTSVVTMSPIKLFDGGLVITGEAILTVVVSALVMVGLTLFTAKTKTGKAMRAVSADRDREGDLRRAGLQRGGNADGMQEHRPGGAQR